MTAQILQRPLHVHIASERAVPLMQALWKHKLDGSDYAVQAVSMLTLSQVLEVFLMNGGKATDVAPLFNISCSNLEDMLHETNKTLYHWQGYAQTISENDERSDDQKLTLQVVAEIYQILRNGLQSQLKASET